MTIVGDSAVTDHTSPPFERNLGLPAVEHYRPTCVSLQYGVDSVSARYCGLKSYPGYCRFQWQHGWVAQQRQVHPLIVITESAQPSDRILVARQDEADYLRESGFLRTTAIGLPIVYAKKPEIERRKESLLVMPAHSLVYTTHSWKFEEYVKAIDSIRDDFSEVAVCIHPECIARGYWIDEFSRKGYPIIASAQVDDRNALERITRILSTFEYMTTNSVGSQVTYASYFGAKVSVFGPYASVSARDYSNTPFYRRNPEILEPAIAAISEECFRNHMPQFFCEPKNATDQQEWGRQQVGEDNTLDAPKLRRLLGWHRSGRLKETLLRSKKRIISLGSSTLSPTVKNRIKTLYDKTMREENRLLGMSRYVPTKTILFGESIEVVDAASYLQAKKSIIDQECYRFVANTESPLILDCGANVGVSVRYFKRLYPQSRVIAFEPDPGIFEVLQRNCRELEGSIELVQKAIWDAEGTMSFQQDGADAGHLDSDNSTAAELTVETVRLRDYLQREPIDMLKLDVEGAETKVLRDCADVLNNVENLFVEYHSFTAESQTLHEITSILAVAGFRLHLCPELISPQPFLLRKVKHGMDHQVNIFAFRQ